MAFVLYTNGNNVMKIGILTFHCACNYGAVLQAYALKTYLSFLGHKVEIIDYRPTYLLISGSPNPFLSFCRKNFFAGLKDFLFKMRFFRFFKKRHDAFLRFLYSNLILSKKIHSKKEIQQLDYDVVFWGSDQIWSPIVKGDLLFWGVFPSKYRKVSYAASGGDFSNLNLSENFLSTALNDFSSISVRESDFAEFLSKYTKRKISTVLDPTLLLSDYFWSNISEIPDESFRECVVLYEVSKSELVSEAAYSLAKHISAKVVRLCSDGIIPTCPDADFCASPGKFLGYIKCSKCVVTTSFHGVALSIVNEKPFYFISYNNKNENRIILLLKQLGLSNRIITSLEDMYSIPLEIDYSEVKLRLELEREKSKNFITSALK